jgi:uncharacterized membrane protein
MTMDEAVAGAGGIEALVGHWIRLVGLGVDIFGVLIIVVGIAWSTSRFLRQHMEEQHYERYKIRLGRSLLLGLEMLVAADIVKTIALEPSFLSLGVLAGLVMVRTFLSWTLVLEIEGRWPWQGKPSHPADALGVGAADPQACLPARRGARIAR